MQLLRKTNSSLRVTQGYDSLAFTTTDMEGLTVRYRDSGKKITNFDRDSVIRDADYIQQFGIWLTNLARRVQEGVEPCPSALSTHRIDAYSRVAAISVAREVPGTGLERYLERDGLDEAAREKIMAIITEEANAAPEQTRLEKLATEHPLQIPEGLKPVLLAEQKLGVVSLQFDMIGLEHNPVPYQTAADFGGWILQGLAEITQNTPRSK